jgi:hypothetical protein
MTATATFASLRSDLVIVEKNAEPIYVGPRQTGVTPGVRHTFREHRCTVKGQKSIDFIRGRMQAPDGPEVWELEADDVPEVTELLAELATADVERVREMLTAERKSSNREIVLATCERILQRHGVSERKPGEKVVAA